MAELGLQVVEEEPEAEDSLEVPSFDAFLEGGGGDDGGEGGGFGEEGEGNDGGNDEDEDDEEEALPTLPPFTE